MGKWVIGTTIGDLKGLFTGIQSPIRDPEKELNKNHKVGISQNPLFN